MKSPQKNLKSHFVFASQRCQFREFGVDDQSGAGFDKTHQDLWADIEKNDIAYLMSEQYPAKDKLFSAIQSMPEYLSFLKTTLRNDFFFAAFDQSDETANEPHVKKTGPKDVVKFILERLKSQTVQPREAYEFVIEDKQGQIIGYVELFEGKMIGDQLQFERGIFVTPEEQASGYGKEAIIAMTDFAFKKVGADRIFTMVDPNNIRSLNNIIHNSGGVKIGEEESKYSHLSGGGSSRHLFHVYPANFYDAVKNKQNEVYLINNDNYQPPAPGKRFKP